MPAADQSRADTVGSGSPPVDSTPLDQNWDKSPRGDLPSLPVALGTYHLKDSFFGHVYNLQLRRDGWFNAVLCGCDYLLFETGIWVVERPDRSAFALYPLPGHTTLLWSAPGTISVEVKPGIQLLPVQGGFRLEGREVKSDKGFVQNWQTGRLCQKCGAGALVSCPTEELPVASCEPI